MAFEIVTDQKSINAGADLSSKQYTFVKLDSTGRIVSAVAGENVIGVLQSKPLTNDPGSVCGPGDITKVLCGGSINAGQAISSDASGRAVATTSGAYILGSALFQGAVGGVISMLFQPRGSKL